MNRIQAAAAKVLGVDSELQNLSHAYEAVVSDYTLIERKIEDMGYLNLWEVSEFKEFLPHATHENTLKRLRVLRHENPLAKQGVKLIIRFTLGKGIQWMVKATPDSENVPQIFSEQPVEKEDEEQPDPQKVIQLPARQELETGQNEADRIRDVLTAFWDDPENELVLTSHEALQQFLDDIVTEGEKFITLFKAEGVAPYVRMSEIPIEEVKDILYDPNNRKRPVWYKRVYMERTWDDENDRWVPTNQPITRYYRDYRITDSELAKIEAAGLRIREDKQAEGLIMHCGVNWLKTAKGVRGISEIFASREWFRVFKEFMQDRAAINKAATAVAYKRKVKGGPAKLAEFKNKFGGIDTDTTDGNTMQLRKITRPAAAASYDSNEGVDLEWNKTDTGASQAVQDGRMLLMSAGTGMATNIHYFGEGGDANLATAQAMELPMVKSYEDWQKLLEQIMNRLFRFVLRVAFSDEEYNVEPGVISWEFPPIISKDIVKYITAWGQLVTTIAPGDLTVKLAAVRGALNDMDVPGVDQIMAQVEAEERELKAQRDAQREAMIDNFANGGGENENNGSGSGKVPGFVKANAAGGGNAETARLARGKGPIDRPGRSLG